MVRRLLDSFTCDTPKSELDSCWPECHGEPAECDGPNVIACSSSGRRYTYDCEGVCATQNKKWSGICGLSYKNQTSAQATCWCD